MTVKTDISRFQIHDELTAPDESARLLQGMASAGRLGVEVRRRARGCARGAAGLRADAPRASRRRPPARHPRADRPGGGRGPGRHLLGRPARQDRRAAGLGLDEISRARSWTSADPREAALLAFLKALFEADGRPRSPPARGGPRGRLERRGAARGRRPRGAERVPEPDGQRGRAAAGPVRPVGPSLRRLSLAQAVRAAGGAAATASPPALAGELLDRGGADRVGGVR